MNARDQLTMFEPAGSELALLAFEALRMFERFESISARCEDMAIARHYRADAVAQLERAAVFDSCYQFETLAGLS